MKNFAWSCIVLLAIFLVASECHTILSDYHPNKAELCLMVRIIETCIADPHCSFIYDIDEIVSDQMLRFVNNFKSDEKQDLIYEMEIYDGNDTEHILQYITNIAESKEGNELDLSIDRSFGDILDDIAMITESSTLQTLKFSSVSKIYYAILDSLNVTHPVLEEANLVETERFILLTLLKLKIMDSRGFACENPYQIPTFFEEENKIICMDYNLKGMQYRGKTIKQLNSASKTQCSSSELQMIIVLLIIIFIAALVIIGMYTWIFLKI